MSVYILITEARRIIQYFKIPEDKRPPRSIWHSTKQCDQWLEKNYYNKDSSQGSGYLEIEDWERE